MSKELTERDMKVLEYVKQQPDKFELEKAVKVYKARADKMYDLLIHFGHIDEANEAMKICAGKDTEC